MNTSALFNISSLSSGNAIHMQSNSIATRHNSLIKRSKPVPINPIKNTRIQYVNGDAPGDFIVKIIDKDTEKIIKEIPPEEIRAIRDYVSKYMGVLVDKSV